MRLYFAGGFRVISSRSGSEWGHNDRVLGRDRGLRHLLTTTRQQGPQLLSEALSGDAVQEEVHGVVYQTQQVADGLALLVVRVVQSLPVGLADQQDDARRNADEERERDAEAHEGRLTETGRSISTSGLGSGHLAHALRLDEDVDDHAVKAQDEKERDGVDEGEDDPRSNVVQEEIVFTL